MKKAIIVFFSALFLLFCLDSCKKGGSLAGTTWTGSREEGDDVVTVTISFQSKTFSSVEYVNGIYEESFSGRYTYSDPVVTLFVPSAYGQVDQVTGVIEGNRLQILDVVFIKQ